MAKTYEQHMQDLRSGLPQGGTKSGKALTSEAPATDTERVTSKIAAATRRAKDRAAAKDAGVLGPLRPPKTKMPESTYRGKTPADAVPRFIETLLGEDGVERSKQEEGRAGRREVMEQDYSEMLDVMRESQTASRARLIDSWGGDILLLPQSSSRVSEDGLQLRGDLGIDGDDPQAIADAADDHAAQYIYEDILPEDVPDAAALSYEREIDNDHRAVTYEGDGPGGEGTVYFYEMSGSGGGGQQGYWVRDDGSVVNVTNLLSPPDA